MTTVETLDPPRTEVDEPWSARVLRCPRCARTVLVRLPGEMIIRNPILQIDPATGRLRTQCAGCRTRVELPLRLDA